MKLYLSQRARKGFSFLEVIIVVFIFTIIMTAVTLYFSKMALVNQGTKRLQRNLEDTQFAFNLVGKTLRTAVIVIPTTPLSNASVIRLYDYSQGACIEYSFSNDTIMMKSAPGSGSGNEKTWCQGASLGTAAPIISTADGATVSGKFIVIPSTDAVAGRVTIVADVSRGENLSSSVQTTVSLRNFREHL